MEGRDDFHYKNFSYEIRLLLLFQMPFKCCSRLMLLVSVFLKQGWGCSLLIEFFYGGGFFLCGLIHTSRLLNLMRHLRADSWLVRVTWERSWSVIQISWLQVWKADADLATLQADLVIY